jgi:CRISPR/Cas system-associated endonuclease/helicase Cas3
MKIYQLKAYVYQITNTKNTHQLKKVKPELINGKDLRQKLTWISIYNALKLINDFQAEQISKKIEDYYGYQELNANSSLDDLLNNIRAISQVNEDIENRLDQLEKKFTK